MGFRLADYLDKGASIDPERPCLTTDGESRTYATVQADSHRVATALRASGLTTNDAVAVLSANDPDAFTCVFGISRAGAVWCPINPRNAADENREILDRFDCTALIFAPAFTGLVDSIRGELPQVTTLVCLDDPLTGAQDAEGARVAPGWALSWTEFLARAGSSASPGRAAEPQVDLDPVGSDLAMIVGTGGTTGRPKGVMLTGTNLEAMTALTLIGYPFGERPVYLALAPLTHAAGVLCFPVMALGGEIVIMRSPDIHAFLVLIVEHRVTHTFLPPTLIYMALEAPELASTDLSSLECFWYGAAPMSAARLEEALTSIGPVMAQLFGQTEAPMMVSMMAPSDHFNDDGSVAVHRLTTAGRPAPLVQVEIMDADGTLLPRGQRGEIVIRSSLVMAGYYRDPEATAEVSRHGWHHTGDIGYLDEDGFLSIVDRAKDMIITGGFNVYSAEVEQALSSHPAIADCAVVGRPDDKWGERVVAVVQLQAGREATPEELTAFVKERIGSVKAPKEVHVWPDLPRSKVGKVLKTEIKADLDG